MNDYFVQVVFEKQKKIVGQISSRRLAAHQAGRAVTSRGDTVPHDVVSTGKEAETGPVVVRQLRD